MHTHEKNSGKLLHRNANGGYNWSMNALYDPLFCSSVLYLHNKTINLCLQKKNRSSRKKILRITGLNS